MVNSKHLKKKIEKFALFSRIHNRVRRGSHDPKAVVYPNEFISKFSNLIHNNRPNVLTFSHITIIDMKKATLEKLLNYSTNY